MPKSKKITVEVPAGRGVEWWQSLTTDQRRALVFPRLEHGDSNAEIAEEFGITPNSIAGQRNRWNVGKKKNPYTLVITGRATSTQLAAEVVDDSGTPTAPVLEQFTEKPEPIDDEPVRVTVPTVEPAEPPKEAAVTEPAAEVGTVPLCEWPMPSSPDLKPGRCSEPAVPGFRCCIKHAPLVYGKRFVVPE